MDGLILEVEFVSWVPQEADTETGLDTQVVDWGPRPMKVKRGRGRIVQGEPQTSVQI